MDQFDVIIIGSGPGGYIAAVRSAQLGFKTAIIEKYKTLGGTCLNVGCIPSKALLDSSEHYFKAAHDFKEHGIELDNLKVNLDQMIKRKQAVVDQTTSGVEYLMKKNEITTYIGLGSFVDKETVNVKTTDGDVTIKGKHIVIATGSKPNFFPGMEPDKDRIITSTEALNLKEVPKKMIVVGSGAIGIEFAYFYNSMGTEVTIVEYLPSVVPVEDDEISKQLDENELDQIGNFFSGSLFGIAAFFGLIILLIKTIKKREAFGLKNIIAGIALGIPNYFSIVFLIKALQTEGFESSTLFTINNVGIVIVSTLVGILLFKEQFSLKNKIGIVLAIVGIVIVALA